MKFKVVAEDKTKGIVELPLTAREVEALGDLGFMIEDDLWATLRLNRIDRAVRSAMSKFRHLLFDVKDDGRTYSRQDDRWVLNEERFWVVKKPGWKRPRATRRQPNPDYSRRGE